MDATHVRAQSFTVTFILTLFFLLATAFQKINPILIDFRFSYYISSIEFFNAKRNFIFRVNVFNQVI